jgi:tetratricopeptide (TPR) repeat protein
MLLGAVALVYAPALRNGFIWDDDAHISQNTALRSPLGLWWIWTRPGTTPQYYPLTHTTFWVQWQLHGDRPAGYHLVNVALHGLNTLLVWRIAGTVGLRWAFWIALVFAVHPVHVESVAWASERKNTLSAAFYLSATLLYVRRRFGRVGSGARSPWTAAAYAVFVLLFLGAIFSKTTAGTLPAALLLITWWKEGRILRADWLRLAPLLVPAAVIGGVTGWMERWSVGATGPEFQFTLEQRLQLAGTIPWFYAAKLIVPWPTMFIYPRWDLAGWGSFGWAGPLATVLLIVSAWRVREKVGRGLLTSILYFGGTLVPALGLVNIYPMRYSFVADHFQYLASLGLLALIVSLFAPRISTRPLRWIGICAIVGLAALSWLRVREFRDARTLWEQTLDRNPKAWIAHSQVASIRAREGDLAEAAGRYQLSLELYPLQWESRVGLARIYERNGQIGDAVRVLREATSVAPDRIGPRMALAETLLRSGESVEAERELRHILAKEPRFEPARVLLSRLLERRGDPGSARNLLQEGLEVFPESVGGRIALAELLERQGRADEAWTLYFQALEWSRKLGLSEKQQSDIRRRMEGVQRSGPSTREEDG